MFSPWLTGLTVVSAGFVVVAFFLDRSAFPLSRPSRMRVLHFSCTLRNRLFPFANPRFDGMHADSKALEEIMQLFHPPLRLTNAPSDGEVQIFRRRAKQLLTGLYPARPTTCRLEPHAFIYDENKVTMYTVESDKRYNWKDPAQPLILYFRGGGFVFGDIDIYAGVECDLSKQLGMPVLHVEFQHVPEYSLEHVLEDAIGVYRVLLHVDPNVHQRLIGVGDSSGGMLWVHVLQWLVANKIPVPQGVVLHSPWPSLSTDHFDNLFFPKIYLTMGHFLNFRQLAIGNDTRWEELTDAEKQLISAKEDSYEGFPPLYITLGSTEILYNPIHRLAALAGRAGVKVTVDEAEGMMHAFPLYYLWSSRARCAQEKAYQWIRQRLPTMLPSSAEIDERLKLFC